MLHALTLIKVEDGSAKQFLEAFLQIAFIDSNLTAKFLDSDRLTNML